MDKTTYSLLKVSEKETKEGWGARAYLYEDKYYIDPDDSQAFNSEEEVEAYKKALINDFFASK